MTGRRPKLTADQVRALREWAAFGRSTAAVARRYGVTTNTIRGYLRGEVKTYREAA